MVTLIKVQAPATLETVSAFELVRQKGLFDTFLLVCGKLNIEPTDPLAEKIARSLLIAADVGRETKVPYLPANRRLAAKRFVVLWLWLSFSVLAGALVGLFSLR